MRNCIADKASKMVEFLSNQFSLPQKDGIYKGKNRNNSRTAFAGRFTAVRERFSFILTAQQPVVPDPGDLPHKVVDLLGDPAGFRGHAHKFHAAGLRKQAGPV